MEFPPNQVPTKEELDAVEDMIVDLDVKRFKENVDFGKSVGTLVYIGEKLGVC